ncbi:protein of unknown function [Taphrina deformans PYCC 5710]|uniref:non-specific serine/threonine protein kinase n=1 Tax=Taphrina deformans (strain PYCC 5710 / ATCC 11124 / CBS 356.35 / IMI 108563 / JCM 9778 / NBRC 8474) TaxID=1097556 RepID=R4XK83_TAPDE|nr:protein of unknown function [Taphrina deformans PYCC 5710]|eukprot:CCG83729.1 protein of unknown function [Taphrina deformans PYCC 5710]
MYNELPFQLGQKLSEGAFASIYLCRERDSRSAELYAIKVIDKSGIIKSGRQTQKQIDGEVRLHKLCGSEKKPNIIDYIASDETSLGALWICMEFAEGGDLFDKIEPDVGIEEDIARLYFKQLLSGLQFIHSKGVSHRDIKPENILLDADGRLKIADFGLAALYQYQGKRRLLNTCCGSPPYAAPEIISSYDGENVDVWSAGVVLFALCLGSTPWNEPTGQCSLFRMFARSRGSPQYEPWNRLPSGVYSLMQGMLAIDPSRRLSLAQVASHPWVVKSTPEPDPITLANTLMSKMQVDLSQAPKSSQQDPSQLNSTHESLSQRMESQTVEAAAHDLDASAPRGSMNFLEDDPALSQFTGSTQILESLTQRARRFADVTGSERLTRFYSVLPKSEMLTHLLPALEGILVGEIGTTDDLLRIRSTDTTGCQLIGYINLCCMHNGMTVVEFIKRKGDPQQWRRLFKSIAYQVRETIYTG